MSIDFLLEPPFCAKCGGTCRCEDWYDRNDIEEGFDAGEWNNEPDPTGWRLIGSAPLDGTEILILTNVGVTQARFAPGEWHDHSEGREYYGPVWVCCDDQWQIEVEDCGKDGMHHGSATHWMPLPSSPPDSSGVRASSASSPDASALVQRLPE